MRSELLAHGDYNVIVVDWAGGSLPLYTQATANTRLVGLEIAHLIKHLQVRNIAQVKIKEFKNSEYVLASRQLTHVSPRLN